MELVLIDVDSPEWTYMWNWLEAHPINQGIENPSQAIHEGESWAYMGSIKNKDRVIHTFRHRFHPVTESIQNVSVQNSTGFTHDQIVKEFKL